MLKLGLFNLKLGLFKSDEQATYYCNKSHRKCVMLFLAISWKMAKTANMYLSVRNPFIMWKNIVNHLENVKIAIECLSKCQNRNEN